MEGVLAQEHHRLTNTTVCDDVTKKENGGSDTQKNKKKEEETETVTVVMKVDFHCHGCKRKIFDGARSFRGAEMVKVEAEKNRLTVIGKVDPVKLHEKLERSTKKKIELVSPQPKKKDKNPEKKNDDNHKPKEPPLTTVVLKMSLHCDGCCSRIRQIIRKTEGVHSVEIDREKELVTVRGAVEAKAVQMRLKMKMKRSAEIVPAKKEKGGEKTEQCNGGGNQKQQQQQQKVCCSSCKNNSSNDRGAEVMDYYGYAVERLNAPQIFSDENPNACSVM